MSAIAVGMWVGLIYGSPYGKVGIMIGFIIGAAATMAALFSFFKLLDFIVCKLWPPFPICKKGKCGTDDYKWLERTDNGVIFQCKCGDKYIMKMKSLLRGYINVQELLDDGSTRPYVKYERCFGIFGHWVKDSP
jgi:hypothetical protein